jgi:hypothetical protein
MALPKIDKPLFDLHIPSIDKNVKCRPFVVREEKILLVAQQSGQEKDIILAIKQVLTNCIQDPTFDVDKLTTFDLEYMFLKLRARSVNNVIEVSYRDAEDDKVYDFEIDLDKVEMLKGKETSSKIAVTDDIGIIMKYPSVTILDQVPDSINSADLVEYLVRSCIDQIYDSENVYPVSDHTPEEVNEFIEQLDIETFTKIREFFDNLPQMYYKLEYKNSLGNDRVIELTSLSDFFTWG